MSRFRPFARRRFSTVWPFFVDIRTLNPCVLARRRVFGWNVRLPFFDLAMVSYTKEAARPCPDELPILVGGFGAVKSTVPDFAMCYSPLAV